ncbi:MAG: ribonuclease H-like domain-containing protein [Thermogemmatispora sp.]|uniref:ribonuclease H-like domain-containing protein n=1 Tax=Thermogemmatispora sp. TaxID=1968838 RepID=UPI0019D7FE52|nr:ribonuclease H-like domain-containing protein [Thermogemmatispora sp.]MBE3566143.1 ribonuclease H-like domain-containing protein [Thermogemmatispora sp.]
MRIFFFSDWRIQRLELAEQLLRSVAPVDVIVYGGDDVRRFLVSSERNYFSQLASYARYGLLGVIGNDCWPEDRLVLRAPGVHDLHAEPLLIEDVGFIGIEGAICDGERNSIGRILHPESEVRAHLDQARQHLGEAARRLVVVSHTPPAGCRLDIGIRFGFSRLGSEALKDFVFTQQPALVLCGHCHSRGGKTALLGKTLVVNGASDDVNPELARAALIELDGTEALPRVSWLEPPARLRGPHIGPRRAERLAAYGITRLDELRTAPPEVLKTIQFGPRRRLLLESYLRACEENRPIWLGSLQLPPSLLFYDVETGLASANPLQGGGAPEPWLIGVFDGQELRQWAVPEEDRGRRRAMYEEFLAYIAAHPGATLCSWSGHRFDERSVEEGIVRWAPSLLARWCPLPKLDLLQVLRKILVLPLTSWSLKEVATWCGFHFSGDLDGFEAGLLYEEYRVYGEPLPVETLMGYNAEDVLALAHVMQYLLGTVPTTSGSSISSPYPGRGQPAPS